MGTHHLPPQEDEEGGVMSWERRYYLIKTQAAQETIGFLSLVMPSSESSVVNFTLHRPEHAHTELEFVDLAYTVIEKAEWETHIDAFQTHEPLDVEQFCWPQSSGLSVDVLLTRRVNTASKEDTTDADIPT